MIRVSNVLISDDIDDVCPTLLTENGIQVTKKTGMTKEQLCQEIQNYDALIVRSATKVTKEVFGAANQLKLVGRAGTGVDNIDLAAATEKGVIVMNTPAGNSMSAAELTCTMILSMARNVPQSHQSMKAGRWERKQFMGNEVAGKTLALVGLGRIGRLVAARMQAFEMNTIGFDPLVSPEESAEFGVEWMSLEEMWPKADYITLHVPLIPQTKDLINKEVLAKCRKGIRIVNCARGGIIEEDDLCDALDSGHCAGAALDVYQQEPPSNRRLVEHPKVVCAPHLGASTKEAQTKVAREIAEQIVALNWRGVLVGAVNAQALSEVMLDGDSCQWVKAVEDLSFAVQTICRMTIKYLHITYPEDKKQLENALKAAACVGCLRADAQNGLNLMNAAVMAKQAGLTVTLETSKCRELQVQNQIPDVTDTLTVTGAPSPCGTLILSINGSKFLQGGVLCQKTLAVSSITGSDFWNNVEFMDKCLGYCWSPGLSIATFDDLDPDQEEELDNFDLIKY